MHEFPSWLANVGIAIAVLAAIVFTIMAIKNRNMKIGVGKEGPYVETKKEVQPPPAGQDNITGVDIKAGVVRGGIRIGHDRPREK